jgi:dienelactone hydrolase
VGVRSDIRDVNHRLGLHQIPRVALAAMLVAACAGGPAARGPALLEPTPAAPTQQALRYKDLIHLFDYEPQAPLDSAETAVRNEGDVTVHSITYASPRGGTVSAYLIVPAGKGPFPAVLYMHGVGSPPDQFLSEATAMAQKGVAGLLIAAPYTRRQGQKLRLSATDLDEFVQCVVDLRRGVDLLTSRPEIDPTRIGYVGHSYGAIAGGVLSGLEKRIKAYVLMAAAAQWTPWLARMGAKPDYVARMAVTDPAYYVGQAAPAAILLQNGHRDTTFTEQDAKDLYQAASSPKELEWYDADHNLNEQARQDRDEWLKRQLKG